MFFVFETESLSVTQARVELAGSYGNFVSHFLWVFFFVVVVVVWFGFVVVV